MLSFKQKLFGFLVAIRDYKAEKKQEQILVCFIHLRFLMDAKTTEYFSIFDS